MTRGQLKAETWFFIVCAAIAWLIMLAGGADMALGNPTAINVVVGSSLPGAVATFIAICFYREDRRRPRP